MTNQKTSGDWQLQALKQQEFIFNLDVPSQENTKLETAGQTHTKECIDCSTSLILGDNWTESRKKQGKYVCKKCWGVRDSKRMYVNGKEISNKHPLYKAGRYKNFEEAAFESLTNYKTNPEGDVYIITNPAWPEWVKVGKAVEANDRLNNYQTSSPHRDYVIYDSFDVKDRSEAESKSHELLQKHFERQNEWFKCDPEQAKEVILQAVGEYK